MTVNVTAHGKHHLGSEGVLVKLCVIAGIMKVTGVIVHFEINNDATSSYLPLALPFLFRTDFCTLIRGYLEGKPCLAIWKTDWS